MGIECENPAVHLFGLMETFALFDKPAEQFQSFFLQPFRMPLHTHDGLVLAAFHCLDDTVGGRCCDAESFPRIADCLVME